MELIELLSQGGALVVLAVAVVGALREWWVPGVTYRRCQAEAEEWKRLALKGHSVANRAVEVADAP